MHRTTALALNVGISCALFATLLKSATAAESRAPSLLESSGPFTPATDLKKNTGSKNNDKVRVEQRPAIEFTSLEASGDYDIEWSPGEPSISIHCDQNLFKHIKTDVSDGKLRISAEQTLIPKRKVKVVTSSDTLNALFLNGTVRFSAKDLSSDSFSVHASGAVCLDAYGYASQFNATISGASQVRALKLTALEASLEAIGASSIEITVVRQLKASVIGAGSVTYAGSPKVESEISGTGHFNHLK
jgi:hypothetical protein